MSSWLIYIEQVSVFQALFLLNNIPLHESTCGFVVFFCSSIFLCVCGAILVGEIQEESERVLESGGSRNRPPVLSDMTVFFTECLG